MTVNSAHLLVIAAFQTLPALTAVQVSSELLMENACSNALTYIDGTEPVKHVNTSSVGLALIMIILLITALNAEMDASIVTQMGGVRAAEKELMKMIKVIASLSAMKTSSFGILIPSPANTMEIVPMEHSLIISSTKNIHVILALMDVNLVTQMKHVTLVIQICSLYSTP